METRLLGRSGIAVSVVGLGCNAFGARVDAPRARAVVEAALAAGITFFDTSDNYGGGESERVLGKTLRGHRGEAVVATKFGSARGGERYGVPRGSAVHVRRSLEDSLERLAMDQVDVFYYHMHDGQTPLAETLGAMQELVDEGKARAIGCANFDVGLLRDAEEVSRALGGTRLCALQHRYNLLERDAETELMPLAASCGMSFVPYWPLAYGLLTGKYGEADRKPAGSRLASGDPTVPAVPDEYWQRLEALRAFATERGHELLDLAIGGLLSHDAVASVIAGATSPEQVERNAAAAASWRLTAGELAALPG